MTASNDRPYDAQALRHVHFIAIGGTGMGSLAGLLKARGIRITGSDKKLYPPMSTALADWGIALEPGHVVLSGACTKAVPVVAGDVVRGRFGLLGPVSVTFG